MAKTHAHHDAPLRTVPQGLAGVVAEGHEQTDADLGAVLRWSAGLGIVVVLSFVGVWIGLSLWAHQAIPPQGGTGISMQQFPPPEPRLLPNPSLPGMVDPKDAWVKFREEEDAKLRKVGLLAGDADSHGESRGEGGHGEGEHGGGGHGPALPEGVLEKVAGEGTPAAGGMLLSEMPSDASGGLRVEDRAH